MPKFKISSIETSIAFKLSIKENVQGDEIANYPELRVHLDALRDVVARDTEIISKRGECESELHKYVGREFTVGEADDSGPEGEENDELLKEQSKNALDNAVETISREQEKSNVGIDPVPAYIPGGGGVHGANVLMWYGGKMYSKDFRKNPLSIVNLNKYRDGKDRIDVYGVAYIVVHIRVDKA